MDQRLLHTPEGVRDIYGREYAGKLHVESRLKESIRLYGYEDIQTPTFEFFDIFSREIGTTPSRELYKFFDKEGNTLVLRPDFTPSIARCAAKYFCEERIPLRFSYQGNTFTNTSNLQGKLKEVTQMGVELINDPSVEADAEMISLVICALRNAGLSCFQVSIGDVEYFKGLCEEACLDEETELDLRALISGKNYFAAQELMQERGVDACCQEKLLKAADIFSDMYSLSDMKDTAGNPRSRKAVERLEKLCSLLELYGVREYVSFDLGMLSKYRYYTGVIFKAYTYGVGEAVVKGGRYDRLLGQFGKDAPAVGFVMVVDSILDALSRQGIELPVPQKPREIRYTQENYAESLAQAQALRSQGTPVILTPEEMVPEDKAPEGAAHEGKAPEGVTHEGKTPEEAASVSQAAGTGAESKEPVAPYPVCRCDSMPVREEGVK